MNIAAILFTYNRPKHTEAVLEALKNNSVIPDRLFIFHDGKKDSTDAKAWRAVEDLIHRVDWCECEIITSGENKGLAASVISGVSYVFESFDAVIVLEDDCVPHKAYIKYMCECLRTYRHNQRVHSVSGYSWPISLSQPEGTSVYACGRISSYGWGTWKDRWEKFELDYNLLKEIKKDPEKSLYLAKWGDDLEEMLIANLIGKVDSWAVFWALNAINNKQICIGPYKQLITNIGFDGSGTHMVNGYDEKHVLTASEDEEFIIPDEIEVLKETEIAFSTLYGCNPYWYEYDEKKEDIVIYGCGKLFSEKEDIILSKYNIIAIFDNGKSGYCYKGKMIHSAGDIGSFSQYKVLVMILNKKTADIVIESISEAIPNDRILYWCDGCENC